MPDMKQRPAPQIERGTVSSAAVCPRQVLLVAALLTAASTACTMDRPVRIDLPANVVRPPRAVVFFFVDGFGRDSFDRALAAGDLPNIKENLLARGASVDCAVVAVPSITYANAVTFLTGKVPGHHGIISNRWFDPTTGTARDYCTVQTFQQVDEDYSAPTIHDVMHGWGTVSLQAAQRRGCDRSFDNLISGGVNWFFGNYGGVDCMVAQNFGEIGDEARRSGKWPAFILAYFPGVDHVCHEHGPTSPEYRKILKNLDRQIGHICSALKQAGMYDRTYLLLGSDHGLSPVSPQRVLDVPAVLTRNAGKLASLTLPLANDRRRVDSTSAVCSYSGSRWMAVHIRAGGDWKNRYFTQSESAPEFAGWLAGPGGNLIDHPAVELSAGRSGPDAAWVRTRHGRGTVQRTIRDGVKFYRYDPSPADALSYLADPQLRSFVQAGWHSSRDWLAATAKSPYPDLVPQIIEMFDSPRAGDIVFFASAGWDFSSDERAAAHGSVLPQEMLVPLIIAGPGIQPGRQIPVARNCDVMPTIIELLSDNTRKLAIPAGIDGVSLVPQLEVRSEVAAQ